MADPQSKTKFFNRELSWLEFNERVLDEGRDRAIPLLERIKFLAITASNLDEFFMVRVGGLQQLVHQGSQKTDPAGMTPEELLALKAELGGWGEVWQQLVEVSHRLNQAEAVVARLNQETKAEINQLREAIIAMLGQYNHWWEQMRVMEELFLVNIVHPGYYLKQAIRQREYLEQEYGRMQRGIQAQAVNQHKHHPPGCRLEAGGGGLGRIILECRPEGVGGADDASGPKISAGRNQQ